MWNHLSHVRIHWIITDVLWHCVCSINLMDILQSSVRQVQKVIITHKFFLGGKTYVRAELQQKQNQNMTVQFLDYTLYIIFWKSQTLKEDFTFQHDQYISLKPPSCDVFALTLSVTDFLCVKTLQTVGGILSRQAVSVLAMQVRCPMNMFVFSSVSLTIGLCCWINGSSVFLTVSVQLVIDIERSLCVPFNPTLGAGNPPKSFVCRQYWYEAAKHSRLPLWSRANIKALCPSIFGRSSYFTKYQTNKENSSCHMMTSLGRHYKNE